MHQLRIREKKVLLPVIIIGVAALLSIYVRLILVLPTTVIINGGEQNKRAPVKWNHEGCMEMNYKLSSEEVSEQLLPFPPPTGLVVTLVVQPAASSINNKKQKTDSKFRNTWRAHLCGFVPSQRAHFIEPHGLDHLILISNELAEYGNVKECLHLTRTDAEARVWFNLDGSNFTTIEYISQSGIGKVFLADYQPAYPKYVRNNPAVLDQHQGNCKAPPSYIQGTRFYTNEMLHLAILQDYDYWVKLDLDIIFNKTIPFNILHDMRVRGAMFAHTAEYLPDGVGDCAGNISSVVQSFVDDMQHQKRSKARDEPSWLRDSSWTRLCSRNVTSMTENADRYYTNFVVGDTRFFQSEPVLEFARFLSEVEPGFHYFRWTDQVFFHFALGLFLGPDFHKFVVDYTALRCMLRSNCWAFGKFKERNNRCLNGGYFLHTRSTWWQVKWNRNVSDAKDLIRGRVAYDLPYEHDCSDPPGILGVHAKKQLFDKPEWWQDGMH